MLSLLIIYGYSPKLESSEIKHMKLPKNMEEAKNLGKLLSRYKDKYYYVVLGGYFASYILYPLRKQYW